MKKTPTCACVAIVNNRGKVLATSRKNNPTPWGWGLPGGKLKKDETSISGALRELKEETGLNISPTDLDLVYVGNSYYKDIQEITITYLYTGDTDNLAPFQQEEGIYVDWVDFITLYRGPFGYYNYHLIEALLKRAAEKGF